MSDETPLPEPSPGPPAQGSSRRPVIRQAILCTLLLVAVWAMVVDRVSRYRSNAAFESIQDAFEQQTGDPDGGLTQPEVEEITGRLPAEERSGQRYRHVRYTWQAGLPWRSYDIWVVFRPEAEQSVFQAIFFNELPPPELDVD